MRFLTRFKNLFPGGVNVIRNLELWKGGIRKNGEGGEKIVEVILYEGGDLFALRVKPVPCCHARLAGTQTTRSL